MSTPGPMTSVPSWFNVLMTVLTAMVVTFRCPVSTTRPGMYRSANAGKRGARHRLQQRWRPIRDRAQAPSSVVQRGGGGPGGGGEGIRDAGQGGGVVRRGEKPGLVGGRRQVDAAVEH